MGWSNPWVWASIIGGLVLLFVFMYIEMKVKYPLFRLDLFKIRPFAFGNISGFMAALGRGAIMFLVIIWLQGIYLPLHGISYADAPFWAGIYMVPMTVGLVIFGPIGGVLTDKYGARILATTGMLITAVSFFLLTLLPYDFNLPIFLSILFLNGVGAGLFIAPNTTAIMNSLPPKDRGVGSGIRATFQNIGQTISMAIFFSIAISVFSTNLPGAIKALSVPQNLIAILLMIPPSGMLFAALLGVNPLAGIVPPGSPLLSNSFFPNLIGPSFIIGLRIALYIAIVLTIVGALSSAMRGKRYIHNDGKDETSKEQKTSPSKELQEDRDDSSKDADVLDAVPKRRLKTKKKLRKE